MAARKSGLKTAGSADSRGTSDGESLIVEMFKLLEFMKNYICVKIETVI